MLTRTRSTFNLVEENHESNSNSAIKNHASSSKSSVDPVGLLILIQRSRTESNTIVKSTLRLSRHGTRIISPNPVTCHQESSFLKACFLCKKHLSPEKDIYMYRGDQGFCSVECRCKQIFMDEMREIEDSTKKMLSSYRHSQLSRRIQKSGHQREIPAGV